MMFYKFDGTLIENIREYVKEYSKDGVFEISVGTDSQVYGEVHKFITCICFHRFDETGIGKGAHVVYSKQTHIATGDISAKLMKEVEISVAVAIDLLGLVSGEERINIDYVDIDINPDEDYLSNKVYHQAMGWIKSLDIDCRCKPLSFASSSAADNIVKR